MSLAHQLKQAKAEKAAHAAADSSFAFTFHDEVPELEAWADEDSAVAAGGATGAAGGESAVDAAKKKKKKKKKRAAAPDAASASTSASAPAAEAAKEKGKEKTEPQQLNVSTGASAGGDMTTVPTKAQKKAAAAAAASSNKLAAPAPAANTAAADKAAKKPKAKAKVKGGKAKKTAAVPADDDEEDWFDPQPAVASAPVSAPSASTVAAQQPGGLQVHSAKLGGKARFGNGRSLVKRGPPKVRDPEWLSRHPPPGLPLLSQIVAGTGAAAPDPPASTSAEYVPLSVPMHVPGLPVQRQLSKAAAEEPEAAAAGGAVLHNSPFSFGFL